VSLEGFTASTTNTRRQTKDNGGEDRDGLADALCRQCSSAGRLRHKAGILTKSLFENYEGDVFEGKAGWRGATKENIPGGSSTEEQQSQTAFPSKTLRAAGLLAVPGVGLVVAARCGDALARVETPSPPWPQPKSPAAAPLVVFKQALK
jgi:hypothetical protein